MKAEEERAAMREQQEGTTRRGGPWRCVHAETGVRQVSEVVLWGKVKMSTSKLRGEYR